MAKKISRNVGVATTLLAAGFATVVLAQAVDPTNQAAVKAWQTKNNIQEKTREPATGWQTVAAIEDGLLMRGVLTPRSAGGTAAIGLRIEFFNPGPGVNGIQALSELDTFLVDCAGNRLRAFEKASYPQHNLGGAKAGQTIAENTPDGAWGPLNSMDGLLEGTARAACGSGGGGGGGQIASAAPAGGGGAAAGGPNPNDPAAVSRWLLQNGVTNILTQQNNFTGGRPTDQAGWRQLGTTPEGVYLANRAVAANTLNDTILDVLVRFERFAPKTIGSGTYLSQQTIYELNCRRNTTKIQVLTEFPGRNFSGQSLSQRAGAEAPAAQTPLKEEFERICTDRGQ